MSYISTTLSSGEQINKVFKLHWLAYIPACIPLILAIAGLLIGWKILVTGYLFSLILFPMAVLRFLNLRFTEMVVTNRRIVIKTGIIGRHTEEMRLDSLETVEIRQGILGRIFNCGTVKVTGRGMSDLYFIDIDDPLTLKKQIEDASYRGVTAK